MITIRDEAAFCAEREQLSTNDANPILAHIKVHVGFLNFDL